MDPERRTCCLTTLFVFSVFVGAGLKMKTLLPASIRLTHNLCQMQGCELLVLDSDIITFLSRYRKVAIGRPPNESWGHLFIYIASCLSSLPMSNLPNMFKILETVQFYWKSCYVPFRCDLSLTWLGKTVRKWNDNTCNYLASFPKSSLKQNQVHYWLHYYQP